MDAVGVYCFLATVSMTYISSVSWKIQLEDVVLWSISREYGVEKPFDALDLLYASVG